MELTNEQIEEELSKQIRKKNGLNGVLELMLNALMKIEREEFLKTEIENKANGYRLAKVFGYGTQIELTIPRDRQSDFYPVILALFREQESYIKEVSFSLYKKGLTTRDIEQVMEVIYGTKYSKSTVSNISKSFYEEMELWRNRSIESHYESLYIDALSVKVKRNNKYENESFYIVLAVKPDKTREIISIVNIPTESATGWSLVLKDLKTRGLKTVKLFISDNLTGLDTQIAKEFPSSDHQKCTVHLKRNLTALVRKENKKELTEDLKELFLPEKETITIEKAQEKSHQLAEKWRQYKALYKQLKNIDPLYFTYYNYPIKVRRMIYTTNWIERFNRAARRTLKIRGALPSEESALALITAVAIDKTENLYKYPINNFIFE